MKILYLATHLNIGGIGTYISSLARGFNGKGHEVYIASSGGDLAGEMSSSGITIIPIPIKTKSEIDIFKMLPSLRVLLSSIKREKIDLIHSNTRVTQVLGSLAQKYSGIAHVTTCHGFFRMNPARKLFPCWGDMAIAVSEPVRAHLVNDLGSRESRTVMIHNGIDLERFKPMDEVSRLRIRKNLGLSEDGPIVGIVARLSDVKGHAYLIRSMKDVLIKSPRAKLVIVGEGKIKDELMRLCRELGLEEAVVFIPNVLNTNEVLSVMDVFVMPSINEGLGLGLIEAMACGVAVIGSNVGGIKSLILDQANGLLVEPMDIKGLSAAILEILTDRVKAGKLSREAREFVKNKFSLEEMLLNTERVYQRCLSKEG